MTMAARTRNCQGGTEEPPRDVTRSGPACDVLLAGLALRVHGHNIPCEADPCEPADHERRRIELPTAHPVARRRGEGVVVVVPRLAERDQRQPEHVARLVRRLA